MKAVVATFNQEKALVGAFSVITNLRMELFEALQHTRNIHTALNWAFDPDGAINKHIQGLYKRFIDTGCINKLFSENDGWKVRSQHI